MQKRRFTVAGHTFEIETGDEEIFSLVPSLEPFIEDGSAEPIFSITLDNAMQPSWRGNRIGHFPCPSASFEVYRQDNGAYQILVLTDNKIPCAFAQSNSDYTHFTIATRGSKHNMSFGFNNALMVIYTMCTSSRKTLLMHSSVVENGGRAFMFLGASGQGKSTHSDMWVRYIAGSTLINDDNPVVRIADDGTPIVYGSPWSGKRPVYKQVHYPIGGMAAIEQEPENRIRKENIPTAFGIMLCSCSTLKFDKKIHMNICSTISNVLERVAVHTLSCRPDEEAAIVSSNAFGV